MTLAETIEAMRPTEAGIRFLKKLKPRMREWLYVFAASTESYAVIAEQNGLSEDCVRDRARRFFVMAGMNSRYELTAFLVSNRVIRCPFCEDCQ